MNQCLTKHCVTIDIEIEGEYIVTQVDSLHEE